MKKQEPHLRDQTHSTSRQMLNDYFDTNSEDEADEKCKDGKSSQQLNLQQAHQEGQQGKCTDRTNIRTNLAKNSLTLLEPQMVKGEGTAKINSENEKQQFSPSISKGFFGNDAQEVSYQNNLPDLSGNIFLPPPQAGDKLRTEQKISQKVSQIENEQDNGGTIDKRHSVSHQSNKNKLHKKNSKRNHQDSIEEDSKKESSCIHTSNNKRMSVDKSPRSKKKLSKQKDLDKKRRESAASAGRTESQGERKNKLQKRNVKQQHKQMFTSSQKTVLQQEIAINFIATTGVGISLLIPATYQLTERQFENYDYDTFQQILKACLLIVIGIIGIIVVWFGVKEREVQNDSTMISSSNILSTQIRSIWISCQLKSDWIKLAIIMILSCSFILIIEICEELGPLPIFFAFFQIILFREITISFLPQLLVKCLLAIMLTYSLLRRIKNIEYQFISIGVLSFLSLLFCMIKMRISILSPFLFSYQVNKYPQEIILNSGIPLNLLIGIEKEEKIEEQHPRRHTKIKSIIKAEEPPQKKDTFYQEEIDIGTYPEQLERTKHNHIKKKIYQDILNVIPEGVALINSSSRLVYANNTLLEILGCSKNNVVNILMSLATKTSSEDPKLMKSSQLPSKNYISQFKSFQSLNYQTSSCNMGTLNEDKSNFNIPNNNNAQKHSVTLPAPPTQSVIINCTQTINNLIQNQANNNYSLSVNSQTPMISLTSPHALNKSTEAFQMITPKASASRPSIFNRNQLNSFTNDESDKVNKVIEEFNQQNKIIQKRFSLPLNSLNANTLNSDVDFRRQSKFDEKKNGNIICLNSQFEYLSLIQQAKNGENDYYVNQNSIGFHSVMSKKTNEFSDVMSLSNYFQNQNVNQVKVHHNSDSDSFNNDSQMNSSSGNLEVDFVRYQRQKKFKNTEVLRKDINVREILSSIFENIKSNQQDSDTKTAKTFKIQRQSSDITTVKATINSPQKINTQSQQQVHYQGQQQGQYQNQNSNLQSFSQPSLLHQQSIPFSNLQNQVSLPQQFNHQSTLCNTQQIQLKSNEPNIGSTKVKAQAPQRQGSFLSQMKNQNKIGYFQYKNDTIKIEVEYKNSTLVLSIVVCEVVTNGFVEQLALVLVDPLWQEMYEKKLSDMHNYRMKMFASLSHELRTPLNCSISMLQQLKNILNDTIQVTQLNQENLTIKDKIRSKLQQKGNPKQKEPIIAKDNLSQEKVEKYVQEYIDPALNSNSLLLNLINDILDFVQIDSGKFKFTFINFDLEQLLSNCVSMVGIQSKQNKRNVELSLDYDEKCPKMINSDPNRIRQVVLNFLSNALKFTTQGKIILSATLINCNRHSEHHSTTHEQQGIEGELEPFLDDDLLNCQNNIIEIAVEDQGIGISPEDVNNIFTVFNKIDLGNNKTLNSQGCGLGLTISNSKLHLQYFLALFFLSLGIAKGLGPVNKGGVRVQSVQGQGSIFSILVEDRQVNLQEEQEKEQAILKKMETIKSNGSPSSVNQQSNLVKMNGGSQLYAKIDNIQSKEENPKIIFPSTSSTLKIRLADESCCICDTEENKKQFQNFNASLPYQIKDFNDFPLQNELQEEFGSIPLEGSSSNGLDHSSKKPLFKQASMQNKTTYQTKTLQKIQTAQKDKADAYISYDSIRSQKKSSQRNSLKIGLNSLDYLSNQSSPQIGSKSKISSSKNLIPSPQIKSQIDSLENKLIPLSLQNFSKIPKISDLSQLNAISEKEMCMEKSDQSKQIKPFISKNSQIISEDFSKNETSSYNDPKLEFSIDLFQKSKNCSCSQVLAVDDNNFNIYAIKMQLESYGFKVDQAFNGQEALDMVKSRYVNNTCCQTFRIIFMDIEMPIKNGYAASKEIREFLDEQQYEGKQPIIIACTAYVSDEDKEKATMHRMDDFIKKPVFQEGLEQLFIEWYSELFGDDEDQQLEVQN